MLTDEQREAWVHEHGPWLYWTMTRPRLWPWVLRDGIQPTEATGQAGFFSDMPARPGHIYFMTDCAPRAREAAHVGAESQVRVNMRLLNLACFATDEDRVNAARAGDVQRREMQLLPRWDELPDRPSNRLVGTWMNHHSDVVDQPEWVWFSMLYLTVAYRGGVSRQHLDILAPHVLKDWEPAAPGELFVGSVPGEDAAHFIGEPENHPT